jgi:hypothetical protein
VHHKTTSSKLGIFAAISETALCSVLGSSRQSDKTDEPLSPARNGDLLMQQVQLFKNSQNDH